MYKGPLDERYILHNLGVDPAKLAFEMALSVRRKQITQLLNTEQLHQQLNSHSSSNTTFNCGIRENYLKETVKICEVMQSWQNEEINALT